MYDVTHLPLHTLQDIVGQIVDRLFLDLNPPRCPAELRDCDVYNPDKDWQLDDLEFISELLHAAELAPEVLGDKPLPSGSPG
jgi:hypothetical protein